MNTARTGLFDVSPMTIAAGIAFIGLVGAFVWQMSTANQISTKNSPRKTVSNVQEGIPDIGGNDLAANASASTSPYTEMGTTIFANAILAYDKATKTSSSSAEGIAAVQKFAQTVSPQLTYTKYSSTDIKSDNESSRDRVLAYRADLRVALEPLLENKDFELDLMAQYVDTKNPAYLATLATTIRNYNLAIASAEKVVAPSDAANYHAAILTALSQFAATLQAFTDNASDPIASVALLKSYIVAQDNVLASFNALGGYTAHKIL